MEHVLTSPRLMSILYSFPAPVQAVFTLTKFLHLPFLLLFSLFSIVCFQRRLVNIRSIVFRLCRQAGDKRREYSGGGVKIQELETNVIRRFPKILQSRRRPLLWPSLG